MRSENGDEIQFMDWVKDIRLLIGFLIGALAALGLAVVYAGEVLAAPQVADNASQVAIQANERTASNSERIARLEEEQSETNQTLRITFCTSPFDLSEYARIQLDCSSLSGND